MSDTPGLWANEVDWLLQFSRVFFEAFRIKNSRERQWWFLLTILDFERNWKINFAEFLASEDASVLTHHKPTKYYNVHNLVLHFCNEDGPFFDAVDGEGAKIEIGRRWEDVNTLNFNSNFDTAAKKYVALISNHAVPGLPKKAIDEITATKFKEVIKYIFNFQRDHYMPIWNEFIDKIAALSRRYKKERLTLEFHQRAPYWIVLLAVWKQHLQKPNVYLDRNSIRTETGDYMRHADVPEIDRCLTFLSDEGGLEAFLKEKISNRLHYRLNIATYESAFRTYSEKLAPLHAQFQRELESKLR